ncbi:hypothetical protein NDU88_001677 [Pleurodeles waltl]|uniref:Reelin domain-containing protein n=2 Tax=Pleurodeles waltl TaxID=8319 RepID=A0AAV7VBQ4_PLEWA|nr:hypothetical protein NDU88_001677 [Pleurodeles waltl]
MPMHRGVQPQAGPAPFSLKVEMSDSSSGRVVSVQVLGPPYGGLLMEARNLPDTTAIGSWINPPPNTKNLMCSQNEKGAITHANTNLKTNATTYTWVPPEASCPKAVTFVSTVAINHNEYWLDIKSAPLPIESTTLCKSVKDGTSTIKKTTWTSVILLLLAVQLFLLLGCTY